MDGRNRDGYHDKRPNLANEEWKRRGVEVTGHNCRAPSILPLRHNARNHLMSRQEIGLSAGLS